MRRFQDMSIATKLIVLFLTASVFLTLGAGYAVIRISAGHLMSQIEERYIKEAADNFMAIDILMDKNSQQIQSFAQNEIWTQGIEDISLFLQKRKDIYGYACLSYYDMERVKLADTDGEGLGKQEEPGGFWKDVLEGRVSAGSDVRVCEVTGRPEINFAAPIKDKQGKITGVVAARVGVEDISYIVKNIKQEGGHVTLIDRNRNILFSSCEELKPLILKKKIAELPSVKAALTGQEGVILEYSLYHEAEFFTVYVQEKGWGDFKGNGWIMLISLETNKAMAPLQALKDTILVVLGIVILGVIIIGRLIARLISGPIIELSRVAQKIKDGDLNQKVEIASDDEIGRLGDVFNQMVDSLKTSYKELKEKYNELTRSQTAMLYMIEDLNRQAKELRDAQDKAVRSEKLAVIGQLASSVAHEIRNPLGVMKNAVYYFNMLELGKGNAEVKENLDILCKEIENADKIISDLLEFSRVKKPALRRENINVIVKEILLRLKIPAGIEVSVKLDDKLPQIEVDALQIQQVFYNISTNAIQAMEKGGRLTIISGVKDDFAEVSFVDTGEGISKENLSKIFEPLFSTKTKGTGLGLSVVVSLIEGHNGKIEVKSEIGKGSTFTVKLPVKRG